MKNGVQFKCEPVHFGEAGCAKIPRHIIRIAAPDLICGQDEVDAFDEVEQQRWPLVRLTEYP